MRLEPFGKLVLRYTQASWHRPFGGEEGAGFGAGDGELTGMLEGSVSWSNFPRRREDGVWTPNVRGYIKTADGDEILLSIHGQSVLERVANHRAILARIELTTEVERHRWLNTSFLVGEGEIDEDRGELWITTYVCVNEQALGPPAIGEEPPHLFRQSGRKP